MVNRNVKIKPKLYKTLGIPTGIELLHDPILNKVRMEVADNGTDLPEDFNIESASGLGMNLVKALTSQVKGELVIKTGEETVFSIRIPEI